MNKKIIPAEASFFVPVQKVLFDHSRMRRSLETAATGKGNFSMGTATKLEADTLGKAWVGEGYRMMSKGKGLVSADGLRTYRFPSEKTSSFATTGVQANFERLNIDGKVISKGHLNILP